LNQKKTATSAVFYFVINNNLDNPEVDILLEGILLEGIPVVDSHSHQGSRIMDEWQKKHLNRLPIIPLKS
jgi:hypothetical protein